MPSLRPATESDLSTYFRWVTDPEVRKNSIDPSTPSLEQHTEWFKSRLLDPETRMFVFESDSHIPVGQIRVARENNVWRISYSIDSAFRGQGAGEKMVRAVMQSITSEFGSPQEFYAEVIQHNRASSITFERAGFTSGEPRENLLVYRKTQ